MLNGVKFRPVVRDFPLEAKEFAMLVWKCAECGTQMAASEGDAGKSFTCTSCGAATFAPITPPPVPGGSQAYSGQTVTRPAKCSRLVFIILAICLGSFGVHNFVAGHTTRGLIQLCISGFFTVAGCCTFGIGWIVICAIHIWALVEIVTTTTDSDGVRMQ